MKAGYEITHPTSNRGVSFNTTGADQSGEIMMMMSDEEWMIMKSHSSFIHVNIGSGIFHLSLLFSRYSEHYIN